MQPPSSQSQTIDLHAFRANKHSQNGEDGVLQKLLSALTIDKGLFCEFGAWDGIKYSNCYALHECGWPGIFIEGHRTRFEQLKTNLARTEGEAIHAWVRRSGSESLDEILARSRLFAAHSGRLDVLSIDIDSDDLAIWKSITSVRPTVVIIEYNPTIPIDVSLENPEGACVGNSARAIFDFATSIEYALVAATHTNLIFAEKNRLPSSVRAYQLHESELELGRRYFFGYDGTMYCTPTGPVMELTDREFLTIPWKCAWMQQPVPRTFRSFGDSRAIDHMFTLMNAATHLATSPLAFARQAARFARQRLRVKR